MGGVSHVFVVDRVCVDMVCPAPRPPDEDAREGRYDGIVDRIGRRLIHSVWDQGQVRSGEGVPVLTCRNSSSISIT